MRLKLSTISYVITAIFSFGGGYLTNIAPPTRNYTFVPGSAQAIVLIVVMIILNLRKSISTKLRTGILVLIGILLCGGIYFYYLSFNRLVRTLSTNGKTVVIGTVHTNAVIDFCGDNSKNYDDCEKSYLATSSNLTKIGVDDIWTSESIFRSEIKMLVQYCFLCTLLSTAVFLMTDKTEPDAIS